MVPCLYTSKEIIFMSAFFYLLKLKNTDLQVLFPELFWWQNYKTNTCSERSFKQPISMSSSVVFFSTLSPLLTTKVLYANSLDPTETLRQHFHFVTGADYSSTKEVRTISNDNKGRQISNLTGKSSKILAWKGRTMYCIPEKNTVTSIKAEQ